MEEAKKMAGYLSQCHDTVFTIAMLNYCGDKEPFKSHCLPFIGITALDKTREVAW